ncbi:MAG: helix-turn-helix domain-containing protein [Alphaproteobacteria bacterium]|nr:helix-turn-helix domain-containing protein [Alphaproteobacteria bacterium]
MATRVTLTPKEASHTLGVSVAWLYKEMGRGHLPTLTFGRRRLIHQDDLNIFIAANRHTVHTPSPRPVDFAVRRRPAKAA